MNTETAALVPAKLGRYYQWHSHIYDLTRWAFLFGRDHLIRQAARVASPRRILEIGCGTGTNLARLAVVFPNAEIVGVDLSSDMLTKARRKISHHGNRIQILHQEYSAPLSASEPFDLIILSYCLTMINPGYENVLAVCRQDLAPGGHIAIVDFHTSRFRWFRDWMRVNHVRMESQIPPALVSRGFRLLRSDCKAAYGGLWEYLICVGRAE